MTKCDPSAEIVQPILFAGRRAEGMAHALAQVLFASDIPPSHWDEVVERLKELTEREAASRSASPPTE